MRPVRVSSFTHLSETGFLTCTRFVPPDRDALPPDELFPLLLMFVPIGMPYCSKRSGGSATIARTLVSEANGSLSIQRQALITDQIQAIVAPCRRFNAGGTRGSSPPSACASAAECTLAAGSTASPACLGLDPERRVLQLRHRNPSLRWLLWDTRHLSSAASSSSAGHNASPNAKHRVRHPGSVTLPTGRARAGHGVWAARTINPDCSTRESQR